MSLLGYQWLLHNKPLESLLACHPDNETVTFHDPFLFPDMEKATSRLKKAIEKSEKILIFGDYDVDGISGTALLVHTLRALGAQVSYRLPNRQEGYGLSLKWIDEFIKVGANVVITVDCGISNRAEIKKAKEAGIDVLLTDHHTVPEQIPEDAHAILHPSWPAGYPFHHLSGSGVAFKLAVGLVQHMKGQIQALEWRDALADLASLGTVADCMPLVGENRWITKRGIEQMAQTKWQGLGILLKLAGVEKVDPYDADVIGFRLGPRINASGRMDTPYYALQLLLNENGKAHAFAQKLEEFNSHRQNRVEEIMEQAEQKLLETGQLNRKMILLADPKWSAGVIGLIAARLSEKYHRPTIILEDRGEEMVASCRTPQYFNIFDALQKHHHRFKTYGGHAAAAGFSIRKEQWDGFFDEIHQYASEQIQPEALTRWLEVDHSIGLRDITWDLANKLKSLQPYGLSNPKPRFLICGAQIGDLQTVGREHRHLKFRLASTEKPLQAIAFQFGKHWKEITTHADGKKGFDIVFELEKTTWMDRERMELKVVDLKI